MSQKVVGTYAPSAGYCADPGTMEGLRRVLEDGYRVVLVNKISRGGNEWLEYIVEKGDGLDAKRP